MISLWNRLMDMRLRGAGNFNLLDEIRAMEFIRYAEEL